MEPPGGRDSRFNLGYNMNLLSGETAPEIYGNPSLGRPSTSIQQLSPRHTMVSSACSGRTLKNTDICYDDRGMASQNMGLDACGVNDLNEDYGSLQPKKSPPSNGKKTKGRVKIKMEYIENKLRRYTTFSKRKTGIMKKAYELSTLTGTQVMLLVASETGHVYTFATRKLQPMITSEAGKALIQTCLNSPDPPAGSASGDQRMSATGFEETELTYNISDEDSKDENMSEADTSGSSEGEGEDYAPDVVFVPPDSNSKSSRSTSPLKSSDSIINNSTSAPSILTSSILSSSSPPPSSSSSSSSSLLSSSSASSTTTTTTATAAAAAATTKTTTTTTIMPTSISKLTNSQTFTSTTTPPIISPLVYQTAQGMMYAAPTNGGVIFSLGQTDSGTSHPQFITIPLSMVTANNGQGELDLTKRK